MNFDELVKGGIVRKSSRNENLAKSLLKQTKEDMKFFGNLEINDISARKIVSNYYDFLRSILESMAALDGYKIYGHEVFIDYLFAKGEIVLSKKFDRFREIRNKINYYGAMISINEAKEIVDDINIIIHRLINKYLTGLKDDN